MPFTDAVAAPLRRYAVFTGDDVVVHATVAVDREPTDHPVKGGVLDELSAIDIGPLYSRGAGVINQKPPP